MKNKYHSNNVFFIQLSQLVKGVLVMVVLLLFIFSLSGLLTSIKVDLRPSSHSVNEAASAFTGRMLFSVLSLENQYFGASLTEDEREFSLPKQLLKYSTQISLDDPRSFLGRELPGFSIFDTEILVAGLDTNYTNMPYESSPPDDNLPKGDSSLQHVEDLDQKSDEPVTPGDTNGKNVVFIYHSHNTESYLPYLKDVKDPDSAYHNEINITQVGNRLQNALMAKGIGTVLNQEDIQQNLKEKGLKYSKSYQESRVVVQEAMSGNKDYQYFIDVHRDNRRKDQTTITINGQTYAKIACVVGGKNAKFEKNLALAERIHNELEKKYPGISRGVFKQGGAGQNGVYNQDLSEKALLIEAGGVDNTFEELNRSMDAFADAFSTYYWSEKEAEEVNN